MISAPQKGETPSALNAEGFGFEATPVMRPDQRSQWCAIKEGSGAAKTRTI